MATAKKPSARSGGAKKPAAGSKKAAPEKKPAAAKKPAPAKKAPPPKAAAKAGKPAAAPPGKKPAARETAPPAPARPAPAPAEKAPKPRAKAKPARAVVVKAGTPTASKLGTKWVCFRCSAKFYDLNKPEPLCPKCGADQRTRPKVAMTPPPAPPRKPPRPMAPLLEDEDDGSVRYEEDIDLGLRTEGIDEPDEDLFPPGEMEEDDAFPGDEE